MYEYLCNPSKPHGCPTNAARFDGARFSYAPEINSACSGMVEKSPFNYLFRAVPGGGRFGIPAKGTPRTPDGDALINDRVLNDIELHYFDATETLNPRK